MKNFIKILILICLVIGTTACGKPKVEDIKAKMEAHLQEKYGEPFVVENIGIRDANGQKFYTARIYPKAIVGTPKELDDYYYATVNIDILSNGKLRKTGDTYGEVNTREEAEKYLLLKAKELFGERIRLKTEPELQEKDDKNGLWYGYITPHFQDARDKAKNNPKKYRLKMTLYLYVFDKVDNEKEKEERRKQLFEFLQYLKKEGLFEYTILDTMIIDEKILMPSYETYKYQLEDGERTFQIIGNNEYYLLPLELRKQVISVLDKELKLMKSELIEKNINEILKRDLTDETEYTDSGIVKGNIQYFSRIYSEKNVKEEFKGAYEQGEIKLSLYDKVSNIDFKNYSKYNFLEN